MSGWRERLDEARRKREYGTIPLADIARYSGLDLMRRMIEGTYPPPSIGGALDFVLTEAEEGRVVFTGWPSEAHLNPMGTVHGGWAATIMDSALACAVHTTCAPGEASTTVEFKVNLVRPVLPGMGELTCEGRVVHRGRNLAVSEATLRGPDGKTLAFGTETCSILRMPG
ncbi:PaaI family thioesterase [Zhengella sp. ZM62]|uniref:PaaI family thioesterase n=1 Tax=Zhengella sedimenti TaxID=3390035 RepID=UPI0039767E85